MKSGTCYAPPNLLSVMPGNRVMLRSGGPEMIVREAVTVDGDPAAVCDWKEDGRQVTYTFRLCYLTCYGAR